MSVGGRASEVRQVAIIPLGLDRDVLGQRTESGAENDCRMWPLGPTRADGGCRFRDGEIELIDGEHHRAVPQCRLLRSRQCCSN